MANKKEVRIGLIGCGIMGQHHMEDFMQVPRLKFTAVSDAIPENLKKAVDKFHVRGFADAVALMDSGLVDAVLIATPHFFHPVYSREAMKRGLHVLTEKPVSVTAKDAEETNRFFARKKGLIYAAMFQMRTLPKWKKAKDLIDSGELGAIQRMQWTITNWFRTQTYYNSGTWRATWEGEGGGVLLNQCPHNLDLLCWLLGTPKKVHAHVSLGKYHKIEVEDEVTAYLEFANGSTGVFITSTGEFPGSDVLEIAGDNGRMVINNTNNIELIKTDVSVKHFLQTSDLKFDGPGKSRVLFEMSGTGNHKVIIQNFVNAILDDELLIAPATEGIHSVELANAMTMSGLTGKPVDLPMKRDVYAKFLQKLIRQSKK
jgi:predicted dehydrogenase